MQTTTATDSVQPAGAPSLPSVSTNAYLLLIYVALFALALVLRLVQILDAPPITDEIDGIRLANNIARGQALPLVNYPSTYYGAYHVYLLAAFYHLAGFSFASARLFMSILGALTPCAVFWLTREAVSARRKAASPVVPPGENVVDRSALTRSWRGPALLAAALAVTSSTLTAIDSHLVWATSPAPLFMALLLGSYVKGVQPAGAKWLISAGTFGALLLQAAPQAITSLIGLLVHYLSDRERRKQLLRPLSTSWPYLGALAFLVVYSPVLIYNALSGGGSLQSATTLTGDYAFAPVQGSADYIRNLRELVTALVRVVGSNLSTAIPLWEYFQLAASFLLLAGGLWFCWRRGPRSLIWVIASTALLMPLFNKGYYAGYPIQNRYLAILLPACYCIMAIFALHVLWPLVERLAIKLAGARTLPVAAGVFNAALLLLIVLPVFSSLNYYRDVVDSGLSANSTLRRVEEIAGTTSPPAKVQLDPTWGAVKVGPGATLLDTAEVYLELQQRSYSIVSK